MAPPSTGVAAGATGGAATSSSQGSSSFRACIYDRHAPGGVAVVTQRRRDAGGAPSPGCLTVEVKACGVNPVDAKFCVGDKLPEWLPEGFRRWTVDGKGAGFDFAGVVTAVPPGPVSEADSCKFSVGDRVFGSMPPLEASFAQEVQVPLHQVAKMPASLGFPEAAALPLVGTTALQSLKLRHGLRKGQRILIIGASGGVGTLAVQIARYLVDGSSCGSGAGGAGAGGGARNADDPRSHHVVAICSARNHDLVKKLGADAAFDYTEGLDALFVRLGHAYRSEASPGPGPFFDLVFDCVSSLEEKDRAFDYNARVHASGLLKREANAPETSRSNYITIGGPASDWCRALLRRKVGLNWFSTGHELFWIVFPHSETVLEELAEMAGQGALAAAVEEIAVDGFATADGVRTAFERLHERRVQGKLVLVL